MYTYNITWEDRLQPQPYAKSCHISADNLTELSLKFNQLYPTGHVLGLKIVD